MSSMEAQHGAGISAQGVIILERQRRCSVNHLTNGAGELLLAALATCYCNDIYREAAKRGIEVVSVEVEVEGDFDAEGESAKKAQYRAKVVAQASSEAIRALMLHTDKVAEIQNTVRAAIPVVLNDIEAVSI